MIDVELGDEQRVRLRRLGPEDRAGLAEGYWRLSPESRYQRFWLRTGEVLGEAMLDRLLDVDPQRHAVWAVLDDTREFAGVGAGSWWRIEPQGLEAEFSATVLDGDQRRGVGTLLLAACWLDARRAGVERMVAHTMPENRVAIRWLRELGSSADWDGFKVSFRWPLDSLETLPPTSTGLAVAERLAELSGRLV